MERISSPVRYSYLSILPDDNTDIFTVAMSVLYYNIISLILLSMVMITLYTSSNRFFQKHNELSDRRVVSMTKNEYGCAAHFCIAL